MGKLNFQELLVAKAAPTAGWAPVGDETIYERLSGATIVQIGAPASHDSIAGHLEGGGLVIDYKLDDSPTYRVVFSFNENGMWAVFDSFMAGS